MIEQIEWHQAGIDELQSPFQRGKQERPLRITFHSEALSHLTGKEQVAYDALRELARLPEIEAVQMEPGEYPHMQIASEASNDGYLSVSIIHNGEPISINHGIHPSRISFASVQYFSGQYDQSHPDFQATRSDLIAAEAHHAIGRDIFVTSSPRLLHHRRVLRHVNARTPSETAKLVGLFLRSRDNWIYRFVGTATYETSRSDYYWRLTRHLLPNMWRYNSACAQVGQILDDDTAHLSQSILLRCARALQARDAIGFEYYIPQRIATMDNFTYHFEYLTLLLSGAFDAQAIVADRVYDVAAKEIGAKLQNPKFVKKLRKKGARDLCDLLEGRPYKNLEILLRRLRNTIHGASLNTFTSIVSSEPEKSFVTVPIELQDELIQAANDYSTLEQWGLIREEHRHYDGDTRETTLEVGVFIEPYTFSVTLVEECFKMIDEVAARTELERLLRYVEPSSISSGPPSSWDDVDRYALLG
jgi:hypothetical protein